MASLGKIEQPTVVGVVGSTSRRSSYRSRIEKDEAELEELLKQQNGEAPKQEDAPKEQDEPVAPAPKPQPQEEDENLTGEEKTYKKRYTDLQRHMSKLTTRLKDLEAEIASAETKGSITPPKSEEDVAEWMRKYPDVAAIVEAIADKKARERFAGAEEKLRRVDEMTAEAQRKKCEAEILAMHSDFFELRDSDEFHDWVAEQPKWVQDALYVNEDDAKSVIKVITLYKYENGLDSKSIKDAEKTAANAVVQKRSRVDLESTGTKKIKESDVNRMSMKEYESRADEIMEAIRTGNFVYDISGGAR